MSLFADTLAASLGASVFQVRNQHPHGHLTNAAHNNASTPLRAVAVA
jgi:hypothetical protein